MGLTDQKIEHTEVKAKLAKGSFLNYLGLQKQMIWVALGIGVLYYVLFKYFFPNPDFFGDSFGYIKWAVTMIDFAYRPLGYSDFLGFLHGISPAPGLPVFIQYVYSFGTTLFCFFSIDYLFQIPRKVRWPLLIFSLVNPIIIFQANLISSDSLFCSLTVCWFTVCLWIVRKPHWWNIVLQAFLLYLCFQVRYTAIFFPVIAICTFCCSRSNLTFKLAGITMTLAVVFFTIKRQQDICERRYAARIFSGFSGWQIANNVLCYYKEIKVDRYDLPSRESQIIDIFVKRYIDSIYEPGYVGTKYMWSLSSPLKRYAKARADISHNIFFAEWVWSSVPMGEYGWTIIKMYPMAYFRYFIVPNTRIYFYPYPEFLYNYNCNDVLLPPETLEWYNFKSNKLWCRYHDLQKNVMAPYPAFSLLLNLFNIAVIFIFLLKSIPAWRAVSRDIWALFLVWFFFYFGYMAFSIFSTVVSLRYLDALYVICPVIPFVLLNHLRNKPAKL